MPVNHYHYHYHCNDADHLTPWLHTQWPARRVTMDFSGSLPYRLQHVHDSRIPEVPETVLSPNLRILIIELQWLAHDHEPGFVTLFSSVEIRG